MITLSLDKQIFKKMNTQNYLAYTHYSHPSPAAVIIIHGLLGCKDDWRSLAKAMSQHLNVYCVDCRNHGESFHHPSMTYDDMSKDIKALLDHLSLDKVFLIGHSMGGKIAMQCLQNDPNRYHKAIIVDIAPKSYEHHHQAILTAMQTITITNMLTRSVIDTTLASMIPDTSIRQLLLKNIKRNQDQQFYWQCNTEAIQANYHAIMKNSIRNDTIHVPTLFLRGEQSNYISQPNDTNIIKTLFTNVTITSIAGAGHWLQSEKPQQFLTETLTFLGYSENQS